MRTIVSILTDDNGHYRLRLPNGEESIAFANNSEILETIKDMLYDCDLSIGSAQSTPSNPLPIPGTIEPLELPEEKRADAEFLETLNLPENVRPCVKLPDGRFVFEQIEEVPPHTSHDSHSSHQKPVEYFAIFSPENEMFLTIGVTQDSAISQWVGGAIWKQAWRHYEIMGYSCKPVIITQTPPEVPPCQPQF